MIVSHLVDAGEPNPRLLQKQQVLFTTVPAPEEEGKNPPSCDPDSRVGTALDQVIETHRYPTLLGPTILVSSVFSCPLFLFFLLSLCSPLR